MASLYLCAETGIPFRPDHTAGYVKHWLDILKAGDRNEFFKAGSDAAAIMDYLLGRTKNRAPPSHVERLEASSPIHTRSL